MGERIISSGENIFAEMRSRSRAPGCAVTNDEIIHRRKSPSAHSPQTFIR
jgi:hypothetical protein